MRRGISPLDLAWVAGFVLGEGNFALTRNTVRITVAQVEMWPLEKLRDLFGGRIYPGCRQRSTTTGQLRAAVNFWIILGPQAAGLAMTLFPLMSPKRRAEIKRALSIWRAGKTAPQFRTTCPSGHVYTRENTYQYSQTIKGRVRQHRLCKACKQAEGFRQRTTDRVRQWRYRRKVARTLLEAV